MPLPLRACPREGDDAGSSYRAAELGGSEGSDGGSISINQILSLKERFDRADTDGGGSLDEHEFMEAFGCIINKDGSMTGSKRPLVFSQCMRSGSTSPPSTGYLWFAVVVASHPGSPSLDTLVWCFGVLWCAQMSRSRDSSCRSMQTRTAASTGSICLATATCADSVASWLAFLFTGRVLTLPR